MGAGQSKDAIVAIANESGKTHYPPLGNPNPVRVH